MGTKILSRSCKNKGAKFQKLIASEISSLIKMPFGKDEVISSRVMGGVGCDIVLIGEARKLFPWSVEAKNDKTFNLKSWIRQASTNIWPGTNWIVFFKKNNFKPVVCFEFSVFEKLFKNYTITHSYTAQNWYLEKYITDARLVSNCWCIQLIYENAKLVLLDMSHFFVLLNELDNDIKGSI